MSDEDERIARAIAVGLKESKKTGGTGGTARPTGAGGGQNRMHYRNELSQDCHEFARKGSCNKARKGFCRFKHAKDGRTLTLEEAGRGSFSGGEDENAGGGGARRPAPKRSGMVSGGTPKKEDADDEDDPVTKELKKARETIRGRQTWGTWMVLGKAPILISLRTRTLLAFHCLNHTSKHPVL